MIAIDLWQVALATVLMLICGVLSLWLRLDLGRTLIVASIRTVAQLLLVGYVLRWVFGLDNVIVLLLLLVLMGMLAAHAAVDRPERCYPRMFHDAFLSLVVTSFATTFTATALIVRAEPIWRPQYAVPILGMMLGSTLTGVSLSLDSLLETLGDKRDAIEMELAHGATRWEAARAPIADAVRRGLIPTLNGMMVVGVVSLPGLMTGQILAGVDPLIAVRYQIVILFLLAVANMLGCVGVALLAYRRLFNDRHQLCAQRIVRRKG